MHQQATKALLSICAIALLSLAACTDDSNPPPTKSDNCPVGALRCSTNALDVERCNDQGDEWILHEQCSNGLHCINNKCSCNPNIVKCSSDGTAVIRCRADGMGWETIQACHGGLSCKNNSCGCQPLARQCSEDGRAILECNMDGTSWIHYEECDIGITCEDANCGCNPGTLSCNQDNTAVTRCNGNGTEYEIIETCPSGIACSEGECGCEAGETRCYANNLGVERCKSDGSGWETAGLCEADMQCLDGRCQCQAQSTKCSADKNLVLTCTEDGSDWETSETCPDTQPCYEGACGCTQGDTRCSPDMTHIETCNAAGGWDQTQACGSYSICFSDECKQATQEIEANDGSSDNDTFITAQAVPNNGVVIGHIGQEGEMDNYRINVTQDGIVKVTIKFDQDWTWEKPSIIDMSLMVFTDDFRESNVQAVWSVSEQSHCNDYGSSIWCPDSLTAYFSASAIVGAYTLQLNGYGASHPYSYDTTIPGYDTEDPYYVDIEFTPGPSLEEGEPYAHNIVMGEGDNWRTAYSVPFDADGDSMHIQAYPYFDYDIDWFQWIPTTNWFGWLELQLDASEIPEEVFLYTTIISDSAGEFENLGYNIRVDTAGVNCPFGKKFIFPVGGGSDFYMRLATVSGFSTTTPYSINLIYKPGYPEVDQPGLVGSAEFPEEAYELGTLIDGVARTAQSYIWYPFDYDYYKVTTPAGSGTGELQITIDYSDAYNDVGWFFSSGAQCTTNPQGVKVYLYLYEGEESLYISSATETDVPSQTLQHSNAKHNEDYYILVYSSHNAYKKSPYEFSVVFND